MSEAICTCHCGGAMFYRHMHAESCVLSREGEEAPKSELQSLRDERDRIRAALEVAGDDICSEYCGAGPCHKKCLAVKAALTPATGDTP